MVKVTIDAKQVEVENTLTIIEAARQHGIHIPHFCWHPRLSVAGNCRICLVEVEKAPKLVIACATQVADGMIVHTNSDRVVKARQAVMEFLLINHPLDCPICDEAGECKLQVYAYKYSTGVSRFDFEKVRKPKRVALGPNVMLDAERCIMCSRCIRFCDEIVPIPSGRGSGQLTFTQRGDHVELTTYPGEQLDNPYSMNTVDLCPVGALTSRDFRFKARVWDMSSTDSICVGCARGCNTKVWVRNNEILRLTPRYNPDVNDYWMCDDGRLNTFKFVNSAEGGSLPAGRHGASGGNGTRIKAPMIRKEGRLVEVGWDEAIARVVYDLKSFKKHEIAAIGSPYATNEDNYLLVKLMHFIGVKKIVIVPHVKDGDEDDLLIRSDKSPNGTGAQEVGVKSDDPAYNFVVLIRDVKEGIIKALYVLDDDIAGDPTVADALGRLNVLLVHASNENDTTKLADVVLSSSTYAEKNGTFVNFEGRVQRIRPAVATLDQDRALDGFSMSRLDKFGAPNDRWMKGLRRDARPSWRILCSIATALGAKWKYNTSEDVFREIASTIPSFKGMSYALVGSRGAMLVKSEQTVGVND